MMVAMTGTMTKTVFKSALSDQVSRSVRVCLYDYLVLSAKLQDDANGGKVFIENSNEMHII